MRLLCLLVCFAAPAVSAASPHNIIVFLVDDLGVTDLGCYGSTFYETPQLDKLAASGMRFTAAYAACPVCSPTRASMMTGRYPTRTGITDYIGNRNQPDKWARNTRLLPAPYASRLALEERTLPESLRDGGYSTFFAGKWHLGDTGFLPTDQGFEINKGGIRGGSPRSYFSPYRNPQLEDGPDGEHLPIRLANETCRFIESHRERPFFAYLSFYSVHIPLQAPVELVKKYKAKAAALSPAGPVHDGEGEFKLRLVQNHPTYAGMIESMDAAVGIVLAKLDELGLAENTVIVFTADNGGLAMAEGSPTSNLPWRAGKGWLYEGGIRVPTIVRWPGVTTAGSICDTPIISNDYFPTLLEAAELPQEPQHHLDGVGLSALLRGQEVEPRPLFWHYPHYSNQGGRPGSAVRDGRWKLIERHEDGSLELYDLQVDPGETLNRAAERPQIVDRLRRLLTDWRQEVGAKMPNPNPEYQTNAANQG